MMTFSPANQSPRWALPSLCIWLILSACADDEPAGDQQAAQDAASDEPDIQESDTAGPPEDLGGWERPDAVPDFGPDSADDAGGEDAAEIDTADAAVPEACESGEDDDGDGRVDCHDPDCFDETVCEGVPPAPWIEPRLWRLTWADEFNGPEPGQEACYDNETTPAQCLVLYWDNEICADDVVDGLAGLNKCNWSAFELYNWMDNGQPIGEGVNNFDPAMVTVSGGTLILRSEAVIPDGGLNGGWTMSRVMDEYDCGVPPDEGHAYSSDCPIRSGAVWSKQIDPIDGLLQTYGRFDVRARLPVGPGSWPAHWMLPQEGPWPGDGEIDIMEAVNFQPDFNPHTVGANFHDGVTIEVEGEEVNTHMSVGSMEQDMTIAQQTDEYHVYSVEWEAESLRFYVDDRLIGTVVEGTLLPNTNLDTGASVGDHPVEVPDEPFHMILNSTVAAFGATDYPDPRTFTPQLHLIDFVRAWERCESDDDQCPDGGEYDGQNCRVGDVPDRADLFMSEGRLVYPALAGSRACPGGGDLVEGLCVLHTVDSERHRFVRDGGFFLQSACVENTLTHAPICRRPCEGFGQYVDGLCDLGAPPAGTRAQIVGDLLTYSFAESGERCPIGREHATYCEFGPIPEGRNARVPFDGDRFSLEPVCQPEANMPNCPYPCPEGTTFNGARCLVAEVPLDSSPFVWEGGFYYQYLDTETYAEACPLGTDDSANCRVADVPSGWEGIVRGDALYVEAACGNVPSLSE